MKEFTCDMLWALRDANEALKGTPEWFKYHMETSCRGSKEKRWTFTGHTIPYRTGTFKRVRGKLYIVCKTYFNCLERYEVTEAAKELLKLDY